MKKHLHKSIITLIIAAVAFSFSACRKDQSCKVHINVVDGNGIKQKYMWVVIDWAPDVPPGQKSPVYPIQLNTREEGFVECTIPFPGIPYAYVYDSANVTLSAPTVVKPQAIKLQPGETATIDIKVN